jgi:hypothetical protein
MIDEPTPLANASGAPTVVRASVPEKLFQLVGDLDREFAPAAPTPLRTESSVGLVGTDLGYAVIHKNRMYLLFGDALPRAPFDAKKRTPDADVIGFVDLSRGTPAPPTRDGGIDLQFFTDTDGQYVPVRLDGATLGINQVPTSGFSDGVHFFAFFYVDANPGRSILGVSDDDAKTFRTLTLVPADRMGFIVPQLVSTTDVPALSKSIADARSVLMYARPRTQENETLFAAAAPLSTLADTTTWRYYAPRRDGTPAWSEDVADARGIFTRDADDKCRGPFWLDRIPGLDKWVLLERCLPAKITFRVADDRLGPWSAAQTLYDRDADGGLCKFMHKLCDPSVTDERAPNACCDADYQPQLYCKFGPNQGDVRPYGPNVLLPYGSWDEATSTATIYFLMSVLNPYSPMVMKGTLRLSPSATNEPRKRL